MHNPRKFKTKPQLLVATGLIAVSLIASQLVAGWAAGSSQAAANDAQNTPSWAASSTIYEVNVRQFSQAGTFDGVTAQIPRLKQLGVGIIWLMPIHPIGTTERKGTLGSPYSVADYKGINPEYGDAVALHNLISAAHVAGMHVILDWVANHTAWNNPWTAHKDWYLLDGNGNFQPPLGTDWTDVIQLNYASADMRLAMIDAMKYWVTNFGIDGFRADAAGMVPVDFWQQAKSSLLTTGHDIFMLAEDNANTDLLNSAFSANYNWPGLQVLKNVAAGTASKSDILNEMWNDVYGYPKGSFAMNMLTNHDENSWSGTVEHFFGAKEKALATLTFTWPGMPLIYNGQETGLNKQLAFFERDPIVWNYTSPLVSFYRKLVSIKKHNPALFAGSAGGSLVTIPSGSPNVLAFGRVRGVSKVIVIMNLSSTKQTVSLRFGSKPSKLYSFASGKLINVPASGKVTLPAWGFNLLSTSK